MLNYFFAKYLSHVKWGEFLQYITYAAVTASTWAWAHGMRTTDQIISYVGPIVLGVAFAYLRNPSKFSWEGLSESLPGALKGENKTTGDPESPFDVVGGVNKELSDIRQKIEAAQQMIKVVETLKK